MNVLRRFVLPTVTGILILRLWEADNELVMTLLLAFFFGSLILSLIGVRK